jgi:hypothetical protein
MLAGCRDGVRWADVMYWDRHRTLRAEMGGIGVMELRVWVKDRQEIALSSPTAARLLVELVHGNSGHGQTHGIPDEILPVEALKGLHRDAPTEIDRFKVFCLQRTPYGGKVAAHMSREELRAVRAFIENAVHSGCDVVVSFC